MNEEETVPEKVWSMVEEQVEKLLQREIDKIVAESKHEKPTLEFAPIASKKDARYEEMDDIEIVDDWDYEDDF